MNSAEEIKETDTIIKKAAFHFLGKARLGVGNSIFGGNAWTPDIPEAEDLIQECWGAVLLNKHKFDPQKGSYFTFVYLTIAGHLLNQYRFARFDKRRAFMYAQSFDALMEREEKGDDNI